MAVAFTRLSWWLWGGKEHEPSVASGSSLNNSISDLGLGLREQDTVKFASVKRGKMQSTTKKSKRKWSSREERRIDREYDVVLVPSDGGCLSGSESDDSDWSIGWMEPHAPDFQSDDETESSFAVLVPCYGRGRKEIVENSNNRLFGVIGDLTNGYSAEGKKYMEQWLSSLQNN
ncbi:Ribosomal rna small subunit methyltransferase a [Thalictrum thalictroides]|uniref:Ribosomal rna small subunit methyltransferase a n=1 Tax=Thalictrum thalictroides TaxID=46969 RepID=A0A7J6V690_THATH|nr:Ribosomal rna small subunit methyltransferase a [Thalictrum thalictroides]